MVIIIREVWRMDIAKLGFNVYDLEIAWWTKDKGKEELWGTSTREKVKKTEIPEAMVKKMFL
jgi:hypothetical protein